MERGRGGWAFFAAFVFMGIAEGPAAAGGCGPFEDPERASHRPISWQDFQGPLPPGAARGASPNEPSILIRTTVRIDALPVTTQPLASGAWFARAELPCVRAYVLKQLSGRPRSGVFTRQLEHEQGHFDVTQVRALHLCERLAALRVEAPTAEAAERTLRAAASRAYREATGDLQAEQDLYDRHTRHGNHRSRQAKWERELAARMAALEASAARSGCARPPGPA